MKAEEKQIGKAAAREQDQACEQYQPYSKEGDGPPKGGQPWFSTTRSEEICCVCWRYADDTTDLVMDCAFCGQSRHWHPCTSDESLNCNRTLLNQEFRRWMYDDDTSSAQSGLGSEWPTVGDTLPVDLRGNPVPIPREPPPQPSSQPPSQPPILAAATALAVAATAVVAAEVTLRQL